MTILVRVGLFAVLAVLAAPMVAQDFDRGLEAYNAGDFDTALKEWRPLARQGEVNAQFYLGYMYANCEGVPEDGAEAARWFRLAAEQSDSEAQWLLGKMFQRGWGVPQNLVSAHVWFNIASANGHDLGGDYRDFVQGSMTREQIADAQARARICMSSGYGECD